MAPDDVGLPDGWEQMLSDGLVNVPDGFERRVMRAVADDSLELTGTRQPEPAQWPVLSRLSYWFALLFGSAIGGASITGFIFGIWSATLAG
jgi:hypothetical protein